MDIVITGIGLVTPLGIGKKNVWHRLLKGESGIRAIEHFNVENFPTKIGGSIPNLEVHLRAFLDTKEEKKMGRFIKIALLAAQEALQDAHWHTDLSESDKEKTGVYVGSGIGGLHEIDMASISLHDKNRVSPYFVPSALINLPAGHIAIQHGFKGPNMAVATACASGGHAIGEAVRMITAGQADVMVVGGCEAALCPLGMAGFSSMRALSTHNECPKQASRPWDKVRDGFVMGEGAGILILESLEHAKKRDAPKIYARVAGYGLSCDAYHIAQPLESGDGPKRAIAMALKDAKMDPSTIGYINAHATSTPLGDMAELKAIESIFEKDTPVSSTKSSIGHLLGAAGAVEAIFSILALCDQVMPYTLNLENPEETSMNLIRQQAQEGSFSAVLSNSFGFGGANASLIFEKL